MTLATMVACRGLGTAITEFVRHRLSAPPSPPSAQSSVARRARCRSSSSRWSSLSAHVVLTRTAFGRQLYAVGNDPEAARKAGIAVRPHRLRRLRRSPGLCAALGGIMLIALIGRLDQTFGVGQEFDVITAAVLGGTSLFGGVGTAFGAVVGSILVQMVQTGMVFVKVNLYLQPIVLAGIIFLAVFFDSLREARLARLQTALHPRGGDPKPQATGDGGSK